MAAKKSKYASPVSLLPDDSPPLPDLPSEIIAVVLSRLPVKSLLRLRCVCKSWRSLISNPKFAKSHLSLASANPASTSHRLLLTGQDPRDGIMSCSLNAILNEKSESALPLDCPLKDPVRQIRIWGSCAGLVCIGNERKVCIWNPSTGKYKGLPGFGSGFDLDSCLGFGYAECIDDYKVLGFFFSRPWIKPEPEAKVYSLRSDSCRRLEVDTRVFHQGQGVHRASGTFVNGALHWSEFEGSIISFDIVKETFGEVLLPEVLLPEVLLADYRQPCLPRGLAASDGRLCLLCNELFYTCFEVWVMKEYGVRDSWTKLVSMRGVRCPSPPLCLLENCQVILDSYFIRYNIKDEKRSYPVIYNYPARYAAYPYIESLVSPNFDANGGGFSGNNSTRV